MFSLAGWPPTSLVWGDRGGPGPYREPPPPYLVPLHCLLYYWPPHMEPPGPASNIIIYAIAHASSSSSTFILRSILAISNSIQGALLSLKGSSCIVSLALFGPSHIWNSPTLLSLLMSWWLNVQDNIYSWCNNLDLIASNRPSVELWLKWTMAHMAQVTDNNGGAKTKKSTLVWFFWSVWSLWWSTYIRKGREAWVDKGGVLRQTQGYILPLLLTIMQTIDNHYSK